MEDRELLESAAKAAGMTLTLGGYKGAQRSDENGRVWNPLTDDGDALRLAVACCLPLDIEDYQTLVDPLGIYELHTNDPYAATRRAIVRAAAEIGRKMK